MSTSIGDKELDGMISDYKESINYNSEMDTTVSTRDGHDDSEEEMEISTIISDIDEEETISMTEYDTQCKSKKTVEEQLKTEAVEEQLKTESKKKDGKFRFNHVYRDYDNVKAKRKTNMYGFDVNGGKLKDVENVQNWTADIVQISTKLIHENIRAIDIGDNIFVFAIHKQYTIGERDSEVPWICKYTQMISINQYGIILDYVRVTGEHIHLDVNTVRKAYYNNRRTPYGEIQYTLKNLQNPNKEFTTKYGWVDKHGDDLGSIFNEIDGFGEFHII